MPGRVATSLAAGYRRLPAAGRFRRGMRRIAGTLDRLERSRDGAWFDLASNGESALLARLAATTTVDTIVDVGANTGEWYAAARSAFPTARIVCVEIAPPLWPALRELVADDPRAELACHGLGADDGRIVLRFYPDTPELTTTVPFPHDGRVEELDVEVRSVERFLVERDLERVDLIKVDVEGAELPIVEGLSPLFGDGAVGVVQFEYGQANILTRSPLQAFARLADRHGYHLGEVRPDRVVFAPYGFAMEDYRPRNMVLCRPDLVAALRGTAA